MSNSGVGSRGSRTRTPPPPPPPSDMTQLCQSLCIHGNCQYCVCGVTHGVNSSGGVVGMEPGQSSVSHSVSMVTVSIVFVV